MSLPKRVEAAFKMFCTTHFERPYSNRPNWRNSTRKKILCGNVSPSLVGWFEQWAVGELALPCCQEIEPRPLPPRGIAGLRDPSVEQFELVSLRKESFELVL